MSLHILVLLTALADYVLAEVAGFDGLGKAMRQLSNINSTKIWYQGLNYSLVHNCGSTPKHYVPLVICYASKYVVRCEIVIS